MRTPGFRCPLAESVARRAAAAVAASVLAVSGCGSGVTWIAGDDHERRNEPLPESPPAVRAELARIAGELSREGPPAAAPSASHAVACDRLDMVVEAAAEPSLRVGDEAYELLRRASGWCPDEPATAAGLVRRALGLLTR